MVPIRPFFEILTEMQYHLGDQNPIIQAKVGRSLGERWSKELPQEKRPATIRELFDAVANYLQNELLFAEKCEVFQDGNNYSLKFGMPNLEDPKEDCRCILCCGNIVKEKGGVPACPMSGFVQGAFRVLKKDLGIKAIALKGIHKPDPSLGIGPGVCDQHFLVTPKKKLLTKEGLAQKIAKRIVTEEDIVPFYRLAAEIANTNEEIQKHTQDWEHVVEMRLEDGPTCWLQAQKGKYSYGTSHYDGSPDLILELDKDTFLSILGGTSATQAWGAGEIVIHGRFRDAVKFQRIVEIVRGELLAIA